MWRLIWVCTVCVRPTKSKLGLYGLSLRSVNQIEQPLRWEYCRIINTWMMFRYAVKDLTLCISIVLLAISKRYIVRQTVQTENRLHKI